MLNLSSSATLRHSNSPEYPPAIIDALVAYFTPEKLVRLADERRCLVAEIDGCVIATAALEEAHLVTCFVDASYQGLGIGTRLLHALEALAQESGLQTLSPEASVTGAGFYEAHGYIRTGKTIEGIAGTQIELTKALVTPP